MDTIEKVSYTVIVLCLITLVTMLIGKGCRPTTSLGTVTLTLKDDERIHTRVDGARIESLERVVGSSEIVHTDVPNYHHGFDITILKDGSTKVIQKTHGFSSDFGLSTDFKRIGVAWEPYYYKDFHALLGAHFIKLGNAELDLDGYVALAYRLPYQKVNNVSLYGGYDTYNHIIGGVFVRLGSS
jgi:hypothetical protein